MENLFTGLISSKTRIKLLTRFFFNPATRSYLRELASEFNVSTNSSPPKKAADRFFIKQIKNTHCSPS